MVLVNTCSAEESIKNSRPKSGIASSCSERDMMRLTSKKSQEEFFKEKKGTRARGKAKASALASNSFNQAQTGGFGKLGKIPVLTRTKFKRRSEGRKPEKASPKENHLEEGAQGHQPKNPGHHEESNLNIIQKSSDLDRDPLKIRDLTILASEMSCSEGKDDFTALYGSKELKKLMKDFEDRMEDELETKRQEKLIEKLYEALRHTGETFFFLRRPEPTDRRPSSLSLNAKSPTVQQFYDKAIQDIFNVWMDAIDLMKSVKDHTLSFIEDQSKMVDREQLTLEAEMLQLAVDFAVNFSKLKTDFLLKEVRMHLQVKDWETCDLQAFMDSKLLPAVYSLEDLSTMARTIRDLNVSVLAEDESE